MFVVVEIRNSILSFMFMRKIQTFNSNLTENREGNCAVGANNRVS